MKLKDFGKVDGAPVAHVLLTSDTGVEVSIISYGGIVQDWRVPIHQEKRSVVLGFKSLESYLKDDAHIGALVGRVANRIRGSKIKINNKVYDLPANAGANHLHGGPKGLGRRNWALDYDQAKTSVVLSYKSPSGEMGYPGEVFVKATYTLKDFRLSLKLEAEVSDLTPINLVQHQYFNLMGQGEVLDHKVQIDSAAITPLGEELTPTGEIQSVEKTFYDLRHAHNQRKANGDAQAYDINYVLNSNRDKRLDTVAIVQAPDQSLSLKLFSDQPGLQFYNGYYLNTPSDTHQGKAYSRHQGLCLEDQMFPDALNHPGFPSVLVSPEQSYEHDCEIEIK